MSAPLFSPFRALGLLTTDTPFAVQRRGRATFLTVSAGSSWQCFNCARLTLLFVGQAVEGSISALAVKDDHTFAAYGAHVAVFRRAHRVATFHGESDVLALLALGDLLLSLSRDGRVTPWSLDDASAPAHPPTLLPAGFEPTCWCHPDAYLNKVLVGSADGRLCLVNFVAGRVVHTFDGWGAPVRCLTASPALDVVGAGLGDGTIRLHNIRFDAPVAAFTHDSGGAAVTSLSFRTGPGLPLLAAGGAGGGQLSVWDLEGRRLHTVVRDAHGGAVTTLHFFAGEPVLMSAGADNAVRQWIFDQEDGGARLLRFRSGHAAPPVVLGFYGDGKRLLSAGSDRALRVFSTIQDQQSRELSQRSVERRAKKMRVSAAELKLPPVTALASCQLRERDWCNLLSAHSACGRAYTWRLKDGALGEHVLQPPRAAGAPVTAVSISACGNFALLGCESGDVDKFNIQSGLHRGSYLRPAAPAGAPAAAPHVRRRPGGPRLWQLAGPKREGATDAPALAAGALLKAHGGAVALLDSCARNARLFSAGRDAALRVWCLRTRRLLASQAAGATPELGALHRGAQLLALAGGDLRVRVFDVAPETPARVRLLPPAGDSVTALAFSADARWLLSASLDGLTRVYDLPAGRLLQALRLGGGPCTALALSPEMDILATAHMGKRGIYLWANSCVFSAAGEAGVARGGEALDVRAPGVGDGAPLGGEEEEEDDDVPAGVALLVEGGEAEEAEAEAEAAAVIAPGAPPKQLAPLLVTLSGLPRAQWSALLHLETLRARGRPAAPPSKPEAAPFFLPTQPGLTPQPVFDTSGAAPRRAASRVLRSDGAALGGGDATARSPLLRAIADGAALQPVDYAAARAHLRTSGTSALDAELRSLALFSAGGEALSAGDEAALDALLSFLHAELGSGRDFELLHALLAAVLRVHGEAVSRSAPLRARLEALRATCEDTWARLDAQLQEARCVLGFLAGLA